LSLTLTSLCHWWPLKNQISFVYWFIKAITTRFKTKKMCFPYLKCRWLRGWGGASLLRPLSSDRGHLDINYVQFHIMFILNSLTSYFALLIKWGKLHFTRHYQYWDCYDGLILNQCLSALKLYIFIMFLFQCWFASIQTFEKWECKYSVVHSVSAILIRTVAIRIIYGRSSIKIAHFVLIS
jgi:hypothetical protein